MDRSDTSIKKEENEKQKKVRENLPEYKKAMTNFYQSVFILGNDEKSFDRIFNERITMQQEQEYALAKLLSITEKNLITLGDMAKIEGYISSTRKNIEGNKDSMQFTLLRKKVFYMYKSVEDMLNFMLNNDYTVHHAEAIYDAFEAPDGINAVLDKMNKIVLNY